MRTYNMTMPELTSVRGQTLLTDNKPYLYRQSPVVAQMLDLSLTGGTVAWNQLANIADATITMPSQRTRSIGLTAGVTIVKGHKYLMISTFTDVVGSKSKSINLYTRANGTNTAVASISSTTEGKHHLIFESEYSGTATGTTAGGDGNVWIYCLMPASSADGETATFTNTQLTDLTQMFGTTTADYVYNLEQSTAGSGIAFLQSYGFFVEDYYPYDAGSLLSVKTSAHNVYGTNLWNEEWEVGGINSTTGADETNSNRFRTKGYISAPRGNNLFLYTGSSDTLGMRYYDGNKNYIGSYSTSQSRTLEYGTNRLPSGTAYIRFVDTSRSAYQNNISVNYPSTEQTYHAFDGESYPLSDIELRGIPKLDASNNLYYDGDTYESSGSVTRKYGIVDLGTLAWSANSGGFYANVDDSPQNVKYSICEKYAFVPTANDTTGSAMTSKLQNGEYAWYANLPRIFIKDSAYNDATAFKTAMSGVYLVYELATPTTETTDAFENPQAAGSTEEYVDERTVPMPVGHTTEYFNMEHKEQIQMHMGQAQAIKMHMPKGD